MFNEVEQQAILDGQVVEIKYYLNDKKRWFWRWYWTSSDRVYLVRRLPSERRIINKH